MARHVGMAMPIEMVVTGQTETVRAVDMARHDAKATPIEMVVIDPEEITMINKARGAVLTEIAAMAMTIVAMVTATADTAMTIGASLMALIGQEETLINLEIAMDIRPTDIPAVMMKKTKGLEDQELILNQISSSEKIR
jgi:hypothetical protein